MIVMGFIALKQIVKECNKELQNYQIEDWPGAVNGL
ncbi:MAG: Nif3-like dinuclear metal center hexameric protein, partial [Verrucomicrobia bacterium]|nr:Nif3-like dinuclear metal center hexameric protein [Verrucomicrobiota bacterium]